MTMKVKQPIVLERKRRITGLVLCIPAIIVIGFAVYMLIYSLVMSFGSNRGALSGNYEFIGLKNYVKTLANDEMRGAIVNTLAYAFSTLAIELVIGLLVSAALRRNYRGSSLAKVCITLPLMIAPIASGTIWRWMFTDRYGIINHLLKQAGIHGPNWLGDKIAAKFTVLTVSIWTAAPFVILMLLAAISSVSEDVLEAAQIDGANNIQTYWRIIFPSLKPALMMILLVRLPDALKMYDIVYIMTQGGPADSTKVISYYVYNKGFNTLKFGEAAAASFLLFLAIAVISVLINRLIKGRSR